MANCIISSGYTIPCKGIAGIQEVYIGTWNGPTLTYTIGTASPTLDMITTFTGGTGSGFFGFQQTIETGSMTNNGNFNVQNGTAYYDQIVEITCQNANQTLIDQVTVLGQGRNRILVLDENGNYFLIGQVNPVDVTAVTGGLGKAYGDLNGYTITFTGKEKTPMIQVTAAAAASIIVSN